MDSDRGALAVPAEDLSLDGGLGVLCQAFAEQVGAQTALVAVWDAEDERAWIRASWGLSTETGGVATRAGEGVIGRLLQGSRAVDHPLAPHDPVGDAATGVRLTTAVGAPVRSAGGVVGVICAGLADSPGALRERRLWITDSYAAVAGLCLDGSGLLASLTDAANRDHLTGCLNYVALRRALAREISRCERHDRALACCFVDLDGFKAINDTHGHAAGNDALAAAAAGLRGGLRAADFVARYGGDEFVVALPESSREVALDLAQRLRTQVARVTQAVVGQAVHASIGVAEWTPGTTVDGLLERADHELRVAKSDGAAAPAATALPDPPRADAVGDARSEDLTAAGGRLAPAERRLPSDATAAFQAREQVIRFSAGLSLLQRADAVLAVSELAANAHQHGRGPIELRMEALDPGLRVAVGDAGAGFDPDADAGVGLHVVSTVTDSWGVRPGRPGRTEVWFEVGRTS
ncbi:MAG: eukaryotic-like serine/threonine-protein kinase [Solirubrobacteraceae bacterium]|nr:eukaryotic-like serine/threonine-protein kinase [Solirubrobacteraceae bacterium]